MANDSAIKKVFSLSPHVEMLLRRVYWKNVKWLSRKVKKKKSVDKNTIPVDFSKIQQFLTQNGVCAGELIVVHSAYAPFKGRGKTPNQILDMLFDLVGETGTVAMPAMPKFKNSPELVDYLDADRNIDSIYEYDVSNSPIKTGVLPLMLHKREGAIRSRHPINSMVAKGKLARKLMENNLEGESPLACGINSSWNHCVEENAIIVGLGTDLTHSLTMIHVAEDVLDEKWPVDNWYLEKQFLIKDGEFEVEKTLRERAPNWGALHFAERTLCKDLIDNGLLKCTVVDGIIVEVINSKDLIDFLNKKNSKGYPYFWLKK